MRFVFTFLAFLICHIACYCQIDSLWSKYISENDEDKARVLFMKIQAQCHKDYTCYKRIISYLNSQDFDNKKARTYSFFCSSLYSSYLFEECIQTGVAANREFHKNKTEDKWLYLIFNSLAMAYSNVSKVDSSLYYADKSEKLVSQLDLTKYVWRPDYTRFLAYEAIKKRDLSFAYLEKSYSFLKDTDDRMNKGFILIELLRYCDTKKKEKEFDNYLKEYIAFSKAGKKTKDDIHTNLVNIFKDDKDAIEMLEKKLKKIESDSVSVMKINPITEKMSLINLYTKYGENDKAINDLHKILADSASLNDGVVNNTYIKLIENFEMTKRWDSAYVYAVKYNEFLIARYNRNISSKIAEFEVKYQTEKKETELAKNKLRLRTSYGLLGGIGVLSILSLLFYRHRLNQQKLMIAKEQELQSQRILQLEKDNKLLSLNAMVEGQELERLRIAQDLHDGLGGLLTSVKAHFNVIKKEIEHIEKLNIYSRTNQLIDEACTEVRRIAHDMVPHSIKISGLTGAIEDLKETVLAQGIDCELDIHGYSNTMLSEQKANMVYRILQELTTNALKHADAKKIFIQLSVRDNQMQIVVEDDGKGFSKSVEEIDGIGLKNVQSRVDYLGGQMMIDSSAEHGTTVNINITM